MDQFGALGDRCLGNNPTAAGAPWNRRVAASRASSRPMSCCCSWPTCWPTCRWHGGFSRALSAPIKRFAEAADRLGRHPDAAALQRSGPPEIVRAADS
ncbi:hypothetical protein GDR29_18325 [Xanthomonas oryzae pv. oryzae]|nr:hypothetical protein GDR29_18325 [Xanthomonas oryzae pv. oryzae]